MWFIMQINTLSRERRKEAPSYAYVNIYNNVKCVYVVFSEVNILNTMWEAKVYIRKNFQIIVTSLFPELSL